MKHTLRIIALSLVSLLALTGIAFAAADNTTAILSSDQTHNGLYARAAEKVTINGTVNGDVWVAGQNVEVNGVVNGNVYAAGSDVTVKGRVDGSVHAAGQNVFIDGVIGGSVYAAGNGVRLNDSTAVSGAIAVAGSKMDIAGEIAQQAYVAGSTIDVSARIGQYAHLAGSDITLTDKASIAGDLKYQSANEARIANDRAIGGEVRREETKEVQSNPVRDKIMGALFGFVLNVVIGLFLIFVASRLLKSTDAVMRSDIPTVVLKGLGFMILTPIVLILVAITLIGLPLAALGLFFYLSVMILAPALVSYTLGRYILKKTQKTPTKTKSDRSSAILALLVGSLAFTVVSLVPFVGGLAEFLLSAAGAGAVIARGFKPLQSKL